MDMEFPTRDRANTTVPIADESFNVPSQERLTLLAELRKAVPEGKVRAPLWAFVQVADISQLRSLVEAAKQIPEFYFSLLQHNCFSIVLNWMQRKLVSEPLSSALGTSLSLSGSFRKNRAEKPKRLAKERDQRCVLTKASIYKVAHIYPHCLIYPNMQRNIDAAIPEFWQLLSAFFDPKKLERWRSEIFRDPTNPSKLSDGCFNMICINPLAHELWNRGFFALRPISLSEDKKTLIIEFHWQPRPKHTKFDTIDVLQCPGSSKDLESVDDNVLATRIGDSTQTRFIRTGDRFELRTEDPLTHPLPSWDLLEMQWYLTRVVSMSAAADVYDDDDDDDDNDSINEGAEAMDYRNILSWVPSPSKVRNQSTDSDESQESEDSDAFEDSFATTASNRPSPGKVQDIQGGLTTEAPVWSKGAMPPEQATRTGSEDKII
ncbi:hypothetical protein DTO195F2_3860 [Paecilomyces variotii]|nr:hypothetical protein DTO195F2_3860 [Paecilomyces variotii]